MESMRPDDREQLDRAADALMASLRQSRALNIEFRQALLQKQAEATARSEAGRSEASGRSGADDVHGDKVLEILRDIIGGVSRS
jgi:hypothetical protein